MRLRLLIVLPLLVVAAAFGDPVVIQGPDRERLDLSLPDGGLPPAVGVNNIQVFRASRRPVTPFDDW